MKDEKRTCYYDPFSLVPTLGACPELAEWMGMNTGTLCVHQPHNMQYPAQSASVCVPTLERRNEAGKRGGARFAS